MLCAGRVEGFDPNRCFAMAELKDLGEIQINTDIDTDGGGFCDPTVTTACYVIGDPLIVSGTVTAVGTKPLVLWSASTIVVNGTIDVGSHFMGRTGPAANPAGCDVILGTENNATNPALGSGGGGGSSQFQGGLGGDGRSNVATVNAPTAPAATLAPAQLRGGCPGGNGGLTVGTGGAGGGAIYLMARTTIRVAGTIGAPGSGGGPGVRVNTQRGGGGGGGSGGMIAFDAAELIYENATVTAMGGGGGSGCSGAVDGGKGVDGDFELPIAIAAGGNQSTTQNAGGFGSALTGAGATNGGDTLMGSEGGGGGGGGGGGYILHFVGEVTIGPTSVFAPPPSS
jgi:hypothetical protein